MFFYGHAYLKCHLSLYLFGKTQSLPIALSDFHAELEPTEMERCLPTCQTMKCTQVERPVCALAEIGGAVPQTFANECEMRRRECHTKQGL